ncbi:MAG: TRAP transporter fused permease subunit [Pseudomonadota bacterium]
MELHAALIAFWAHRAATARVPAAAAIIPALAALISGAWIVRYFGTTEAVFLEPTLPVIGFGCTTIALVLSAAFGAAGRPLTLIVIAFLTFGFLGQFAPGITSLAPTEFTSYITYLAYGSDGLFGRALDIISNIVLVFIIFGVFFDVAGGGRVVANIALRLAARSRASAIKACVLASGLFGTVSGAATSNVMTSGAFSIPSMRRIGVRNETAAGIEAAASTCGQIMPPVLGAAAFFLADLVSASYGTVVIASIAPALFCYYAFFRQADRVPLAPSQDGAEEAPEPLSPRYLLYLLPPAAILYFLMQSSAFVSLAAIAGAAACLAIAIPLIGLRETAARLWQKLPDLMVSAMHLIIVAASVGLLLGVLYSTGLAIAGAVWIGKIGESNLLLALVLTGISAFVLGMGVATVGVYIVAATLLAPGLISAGIPPMAAHFFVLYCGILSMITPPVAFASLAASALAKADFTATSLQAMRFGWILFAMPFLIALQPGLVMSGTLPEIALALFTVFIFITIATSQARGPLRAAMLALSGGAILLGNAPAASMLLSCAAITPLVVEWFRSESRHRLTKADMR